MFDRYRYQVFIFSRAVDCLSHYLRPKGFALPIIEQEVNVILQTGNTKRSNRTVKIPAKSQPSSTVRVNCDWFRNSADSVVGDLIPVWNWQRIAPVITFDLNTYDSTVWIQPICLCGQNKSGGINRRNIITRWPPPNFSSRVTNSFFDTLPVRIWTIAICISRSP